MACLFVGVLFVTPDSAEAAPKPNPNRSERANTVLEQKFGGGQWGATTLASRVGASVPELDMGAAGNAAVLLLGGVAYLVSRRREQH